MNRALTTWKWSLGVVARSYRTVILLAVCAALWIFAGYEWLGTPAESSVLLMILSAIWALAQIVIAAVLVGGTIAGAGETAAIDGGAFGPGLLWTLGRKKIVTTVVFCLASLVLAWLVSGAFDWVNAHSVEVASFLTFHLEKPVSHELIENIYDVIEWVLWIVIGGFLLTFFIEILRVGWRGAAKQSAKMLAANAFGSLLLTDLLSAVAFGGVAYELINWHPRVPPGFWDYTQVSVRFSLALVILCAGIMFWSLSLARLQSAKQDTLPLEPPKPLL